MRDPRARLSPATPASSANARCARLAARVAFVVCALGISQLQPRLARQLHGLKDPNDIYAFPPPAVLRVATLGYVAATVDYLWARLLVEHGQHWGEHRAFPALESYLAAIIELEPTYRPFYDYVDSLLCYRPQNGHEADARLARAYLERGTRELPNDAEIWTKYGQFVAFMGPSYLPSKDEQYSWRKDGSLALTHAVELGADVDLGIAASAVLDSRVGETRAAISSLERAYALTDDEEKRSEIAARLELLHVNEATDKAHAVFDIIKTRWQDGYPFLDRGTFMLIGPKTDAFLCVGPTSSLENGCARDWESYVPVR